MEVCIENIFNEYIIEFKHGNQTFRLGYRQDDLESAEWMKSMLEKAFNNFEIEILSKYIEHPNKPGHKRSDIVNRIKQLNNI